MSNSYAAVTVLIFAIVDHAPREDNQWMVGRDWAALHIHECIVGWPGRLCIARTLGRRANWLGRL
jgi:hypothetical protein